MRYRDSGDQIEHDIPGSRALPRDRRRHRRGAVSRRATGIAAISAWIPARDQHFWGAMAIPSWAACSSHRVTLLVVPPSTRCVPLAQDEPAKEPVIEDDSSRAESGSRDKRKSLAVCTVPSPPRTRKAIGGFRPPVFFDIKNSDASVATAGRDLRGVAIPNYCSAPQSSNEAPLREGRHYWAPPLRTTGKRNSAPGSTLGITTSCVYGPMTLECFRHCVRSMLYLDAFPSAAPLRSPTPRPIFAASRQLSSL